MRDKAEREADSGEKKKGSHIEIEPRALVRSGCR